MISYFCQVTSLKNLLSKRPKAQISTLLILMMVVILIFILVTVNIGEVSLKATAMANAADSAALSLASSLATRARVLYEGPLESNLEKCKSISMLGAILAVVIAVIAIIVTWGAALPAVIPLLGGAVVGTSLAATVAVGAIAGAIGGAIGAAIAGPDTGQHFWSAVGSGALQGAAIGAAVGGAIGGAAATGTQAATMNVATQSVAMGVPVAEVTATGIALGALAAGSSIYMESASNKATAESFAAASKSTQGLNEYDQIREGVFLQILPALSDDPTKVQDNGDPDGDGSVDEDIKDSNGNGDITEKVPRFFVLWAERMKIYESIVSQMQDIVNNFVNGSLANFESYLKMAFTENSYVYDSDTDQTTTVLPQFYREEIEGEDGWVLGFMRWLYENDKWLVDNGYSALGPAMSLIFQPGPDKTTLDAWEANDCDPDTDASCVPPAYYDEVDTVIVEVKDFLAVVDDVQSESIRDLTSTFQTWFPQFYELDTVDTDTGVTTVNDADYYDRFAEMINGDTSANPARYGISYWKGKDVGDADYDPNYGILEPKRLAYKALPRYPLIAATDVGGNPIYQTTGGTLPVDGSGIPIYTPLTDGKGNTLVDGNSNVIYETTGGTQTSTPAYIYDWAKVDPNVLYWEELPSPLPDDYFLGVKDALKNLISQIQGFQGASVDTYNNMNSLYAQLGGTLDSAALSGYNPINYTWTDSRGEHTLQAETGPYKLASVKTKKKGKWYKRKICQKLQDYSDDGTNCWVKITRADPKNSGVGSGRVSFASWNPFASGEDKIIRKSKASYSYNEMPALKGIK